MGLKDIGAIVIDGENTRLATCWRVARQDGTVQGFTDHDEDIVVDGETYSASTGFTPSAVSGKADMSIDELDIEGILSDDSITEADLLAGRYDHAEIRVFFVDWANPAAGKIKMRRGWLGPVTSKRGRFVATLHGLLSKAQNTQGREYGAWCDANLGDSRCGVDLGPYTLTGTITTAGDRDSFTSSDLFGSTANYYQNGIITFTSGLNAGLSMEVKSSDGASVELFLPMPFNIAAGDTYTITAGCNKSVSQCRSRFFNVVNFRGFPFIPTTDEQVSGPDSPGTEIGVSFDPETGGEGGGAGDGGVAGDGTGDGGGAEGKDVGTGTVGGEISRTDARVLNWVTPEELMSALGNDNLYQNFWPNAPINTLSEPGRVALFASGAAGSDYALLRTEHPALPGKYAFRHRINSAWRTWVPGVNDTWRSEILQPGEGANTLQYGRTFWIAFSHTYDADILDAGAGSMSVLDFHTNPDAGDTVGPGPLGVFLEGGVWTMYARYATANPTSNADVTSTAIHSFSPVAGREYRFVLEVRPDYDLASGPYLNLWKQEGEAGTLTLVGSYTGRIGYPDSNEFIFFKHGIYCFAGSTPWTGTQQRTMYTRGFLVIEDLPGSPTLNAATVAGWLSGETAEPGPSLPGDSPSVATAISQMLAGPDGDDWYSGWGYNANRYGGVNSIGARLKHDAELADYCGVPEYAARLATILIQWMTIGFKNPHTSSHNIAVEMIPLPLAGHIRPDLNGGADQWIALNDPTGEVVSGLIITGTSFGTSEEIRNGGRITRVPYNRILHPWAKQPGGGVDAYVTSLVSQNPANVYAESKLDCIIGTWWVRLVPWDESLPIGDYTSNPVLAVSSADPYVGRPRYGLTNDGQCAQGVAANKPIRLTQEWQQVSFVTLRDAPDLHTARTYSGLTSTALAAISKPSGYV